MYRTFITIGLMVYAICALTPCINAQIADEYDFRPDAEASQTLPILHINVFGEDDLDNDILSRNLDHKEFFDGVYWITDGGDFAIGSEAEPLKLKIKARGNVTRKAFSKKPFKLKLNEKQSLLGLTFSRHFALLPHADDHFAYLKNFTAFNLGKRIELPWTPAMRPIEVYINGDYRGLYFLTESIRVEPQRVNIEELNGAVTDTALISGGYIVEMDNYTDENQFVINEKSYVEELNRTLRITVKSPDVCSDEQFRFLTLQFQDMNDAVGSCDDALWSLLDMDDAVRYYIVMEIIGHTEAYGGSTYLFRNRGENEKWHYSPLWDCGHAFEATVDDWLVTGVFNNRWVASMCENLKFQQKVKETWMWFMSSKFPGFYGDAEAFITEIADAAKSDRERWRDVPSPNGYTYSVANNSDVSKGHTKAIEYLDERIEWLCSMFGDYRDLAEPADEPQRDDTPAKPLSNYFAKIEDNVSTRTHDVWNLQGVRVKCSANDLSDLHPGIYIVNGRKMLIMR